MSLSPAGEAVHTRSRDARRKTSAIGLIAALSLASAPAAQADYAAPSAWARASAHQVPQTTAGTNPRLWWLPRDSNGFSAVFGMTPDGGHLYLRTDAKLNPDDPMINHLYDVHAGLNHVIAADANGYVLKFTDDGSGVAFRSQRQLTPDDTDTLADIYVENEGAYYLVSKGTEISTADVSAVAPNSEAVIFRSDEALVPEDTDAVRRYDLYRWNLATDALTLLTPNTVGDVDFVAANSDLSRVLFRSDEDLAGTGMNAPGRTYERVGGSYVVRTDGQVKTAGNTMSRIWFSSSSSYSSADTDVTQDVYSWNSTTGVYTLLTPGTATDTYIGQVSLDGSRFTASTSDALDPADQDTEQDHYLFESGAAPILLTREAQTDPNHSVVGNADLSIFVERTIANLTQTDLDSGDDLFRIDPHAVTNPVMITGNGASGVANLPLYAISPDGNRILFGTGEQLAPEDTDGYLDLYAWQPSGRTLLSPRTPTNTLLNVVVARDASRIAFATQDNALPEDTLGGFDSYIVDFDVDPPVPTISGPALSSPTVDLSVTWPGARRTRCELDGVDIGSCASPWSVTGLAPGSHGAAIHAWDGTGNEGSAAWSWEVDATLPTATAPVASLAVGTQVGTSKVPLTLNWTGSDANGIAGTKIEQQLDGGAWTVTAASVSGFSSVRSLSSGHTYRFRVTTRDTAGNLSIPATGPSFRLTATQETSSAIGYTASWLSSSSSTYMAGHAKRASASTARATCTFTGKQIWWVSSIGSTRGSAKVYIDGIYRRTLSLYASSTTPRRVVYGFSWSSAGAHKIQIRVIGTAGHPRVDIDAFIVVR
jgi:hypothetical protein